MNKKNPLKSLSKLELLELLAEQEREIQKLEHRLEEQDKIIQQRTLCMERAGNIAQAALHLNGVFEAAQKAADQYVESVKAMVDDELRKSRACPNHGSGINTRRNRGTEQTAAAAEVSRTFTREEVVQILNQFQVLQDAERKKDVLDHQEDKS